MDLTDEKVGDSKVVIVGAGAVGSTFAYALLIRGLASQIAMIDLNKEKAEGEVMDLNHGLPFAYPTKIWAGDYSDCADADIVVVSVDKGQKIQQSRLELAQDNFQILKQTIPSITRYNKECILLIVTNPLDVMTYAALKLSGLPKNKVIGSGTALDSARLRYLLGEHFQVDPRNVHAYIIGEHGDSEVPVWSLANVAGVRLRDYCPACGLQYRADDFNNMFLKVRNAGYEIIKMKGRTFYAVALAMTKIVESILRNENAVLTVSCFLENYRGVSNTCLSVPVILGRTGVKQIIELPLDRKEVTDFQKSAAIIRDATRSIGL